MNFLSRIILNIRRKKRALKLGVSFRMRSDFNLPQSLVIGKSRKDICIPNEEGFKSMFTEIFLDDDYSLELLKNKKIEKIIDIGANIGLFSIWARTVFPAARIHAYEPDPQWHDCLSKNADIFNFTCFPEAVGGHPGNAKMAAGMRVVEDGSSEIRMVSFDSCLERFEGGGRFSKDGLRRSRVAVLK